MFGKRLKETRKEKGLTQAQLAELVQVSKTTVSGWENELSYPSVDALVRLCGALSVSADYLFGIEHEGFIVVYGLSEDSIGCIEMVADYMRRRNKEKV